MSSPAANAATPMLSIQRQLAARWWQLPRRDRKAVLWALTAVVLVIVWFAAIRPAMTTLSAAPAQLDALDLQIQQMQRLAAESRDLRATPPVSMAQATSALQSATNRLGTAARLSLVGDRATLTLTAVSAEGLRNWLNEARVAARARPVELQLTRAGQGYTGTLVVTLGGAP
jgi:general secretion pathway protein M